MTMFETLFNKTTNDRDTKEIFGGNWRPVQIIKHSMYNVQHRNFLGYLHLNDGITILKHILRHIALASMLKTKYF